MSKFNLKFLRCFRVQNISSYSSVRMFKLVSFYLEREKQISYINPYMWNLEKWYRWSYLQSRNRDTDVENKHMDTKGERAGWNELGDGDWHIYTINTMY